MNGSKSLKKGYGIYVVHLTVLSTGSIKNKN